MYASRESKFKHSYFTYRILSVKFIAQICWTKIYFEPRLNYFVFNINEGKKKCVNYDIICILAKIIFPKISIDSNMDKKN